MGADSALQYAFEQRTYTPECIQSCVLRRYGHKERDRPAWRPRGRPGKWRYDTECCGGARGSASAAAGSIRARLIISPRFRVTLPPPSATWSTTGPRSTSR
eukprot:6187435-Pleurochrysis_carterae.AAC.1